MGERLIVPKHEQLIRVKVEESREIPWHRLLVVTNDVLKDLTDELNCLGVELKLRKHFS